MTGHAQRDDADDLKSSLPSVRAVRSLTPDETDSPAAASTSSSTGLTGRLQNAFSIFTAGKAAGSARNSADGSSQAGTEATRSLADASQQELIELKCPQPAADGRVVQDPDSPDSFSWRQSSSRSAAGAAPNCADAAGDALDHPISMQPASRHVNPASEQHCVPLRAACQSPLGKQGSASQPGSKKLSTHFDPNPKRHRSAGDLHAGASPSGVLAGLVSKLRPASSSHEVIPASSDEAHPDGLEGHTGNSATDEANNLDQGHDEVADALSAPAGGVDSKQDASEKCLQQCPVAGLEHVAPFARYASKAVDKIEAASLQKCGLQRRRSSLHHSQSLLHPFAPPRSCNAAQRSQSLACAAPALQQYACKAGKDSE